jgi:peptidyl-prolyl cis-trans isomerase C
MYKRDFPRGWRGCAILLFSTVIWGHAPRASAAEPDPSAVIAESLRARLTVADYVAAIAKLPPAARGEFAADPDRLRQFLDNLYMLRVLAADARGAGLDKDPILARQIAQQVDLALARARVERIEATAAAEFDRDRDHYVSRARELYDVNPDKYKTPERLRVAHILVKVESGDTAAALRKAQRIRAEAVAGADFGKLASEYSDDTATRSKGGELGFITANAVDPAFAAAAFALTKPGDVSEPVLSKFGYHVILLEDRKPGESRTFEAAMPELLAQLRAKALEEARAAAQRAIFSDPTLKVNAAIIEEIHRESGARVAHENAAPQAPAAPSK